LSHFAGLFDTFSAASVRFPGVSYAFSSTSSSELNPKVRKMIEGQITSVLESFKGFGKVRSPARVTGKSGVEHLFSFASGEKDNLKVVGDVILGTEEKDETKVLSLFIKVYDVGAKRAILCVTPRLTPEASRLARLYNILTVESPDAKLLPNMLQDLLRRLAKSS
jgi:hypothetical protein